MMSGGTYGKNLVLKVSAVKRIEIGCTYKQNINMSIPLILSLIEFFIVCYLGKALLKLNKK